MLEFDIEKLAKLASMLQSVGGQYFLASPIYQRPIEDGADIPPIQQTGHLAGHNDVLAG